MPSRLSMRQSSGYDSWERNRHYGKSLYKWTRGFIKKHTNEPFDHVYSLYRRSLKEKYVKGEDFDNMIWTFKDLINYHETRKYSYWNWSDYYVDDEGIIRVIPKPKKNRDIIITSGDPIVHYVIKDNIRKNPELFRIITNFMKKSFGDYSGYQMAHEGINEKVFKSYSPGVSHFNKLCREMDLHAYMMAKFKYYSTRHYYYWEDVWVPQFSHPQTRILRYGTKAYFRYVNEQQKAKKIEYKKKTKAKREEFDRREEELKIIRKQKENQEKLQRDLLCGKIS